MFSSYFIYTLVFFDLLWDPTSEWGLAMKLLHFDLKFE